MRTFKNYLLALITLSLLAACENEENDIGAVIQDHATIYNGICDTIVGDDITAYTLYDDSLLTAAYTSGILGQYNDETFGKVTSTLYSQLSLNGNTGLDLSEKYTIDSVQLTITIDNIYPINEPCSLHFIINQLAESLSSDKPYYNSSTTPTGDLMADTTIFFDPTTTNTVTINLHDNMRKLLNQRFENAEAFHNIVKGLAIKLADDTRSTHCDNICLTINFANAATTISTYYRYEDENNVTKSANCNFTLGCNSTSTTTAGTHYFNYTHSYRSPFDQLANKTIDSLDGRQQLYLLPLGGTYVYLNIDKYIKAFKAKHPYAVINYAELLMPTSNNADTLTPIQIIAYKQYANGYDMVITDYNSLTNPFSYGGFDGTYNKAKKHYRLRISQYMQEILRDNADYGMLLFINERRSTARRTVINGPDHSNPLRIAFIYSE